MLESYLHSYVENLTWTLQEIDRAALARVVQVLLAARESGRRVLIIGNGGSAATASHMACDLGKGTADPGSAAARRFRVVSLADNQALITAIGNDYSFDDVFVEQLRIVMDDGDVVIAISASGNSPNLVRAVEYARSRGAETIALLGFGGGRLKALVDHPLVVSSRNYGIAEDFHLIAMHVLTQYLRRALAGPARPVAFLDRDGVINVRPAPHEYVRSWEEFRFADGAAAFLRGLRQLGFETVVVTNQQGVGKGIVSPGALQSIHDGMRRALEAEGVALAGVFHCPHLEQAGCFCRKPKPGLVYRALNELPFLVDLPRSVLIGDSDADVEAGRAAGLRSLLLQGARDTGREWTAGAATPEEVLAVLGAAAATPGPFVPQF